MTDSVLSALEAELEEIKSSKSAAIAQLRDLLTAGRSPSQIDDLLDDEIEEMKGHFGAKAANEASDDDATAALSEAEDWIARNISNGSIETRIAGALLLSTSDQLTARWASAEPSSATSELAS